MFLERRYPSGFRSRVYVSRGGVLRGEEGGGGRGEVGVRRGGEVLGFDESG